MDIPELVAVCSQDESMPFLVIGGYAVIAHGYARFTYDLNFLVRREQRDEWLKKLKSLGYVNFQHHQNFIQTSAAPGGVDLDLMLVADETFASMLGEARPIRFGNVEARTVCVDHLLALKLHVIKHGLPHRIDRDMDDVKTLVRKNNLDIESKKYQEWFLKYGSAAIYEQVIQATRQ